MERERGRNGDTTEKVGRRKKEKEGKTWRKRREKFQIIQKVQVVINRKERCSASDTGTRHTANGGEQAGRDTQADTGAAPPVTLNEINGTSHSYSFRLTSSSHKVTINWQHSHSAFQTCEEGRNYHKLQEMYSHK